MHNSIAYAQYALRTIFNTLPVAHCQDTEGHNFSQLTLYQYNTCPFCCKVKAYLNARKFKYSIVEVDPLLKREIKFSPYKKVPFLIIDGNQRIEDSTLIISVLESMKVTGKPIETILSYFPSLVTKNGKKEVTDFLNKYVITHGNAENLDARREESKWRQWVDDTFIHKLPVNIYRSPSEALKAFDYLMGIEGFSSTQKFFGKYIGAVSMYFIAKRLRKRHHIMGDVRDELFHDGKKWVKAIGTNRIFLGGEEPNLADISVFGVLSSIEGLDTFRDLMAQNATLEKWYKEVKMFVGVKK